ncbi:MAG: Asp-tRNA(Asn)/Glu-tRNA(Gln) amidotransferase GatCAB subunit B, partial [Campylobacter sp.]|nr:Asp-tRNA(Asn)/Glu-tRNA(Gln) amidotransferase GatCAB subunit B [Campylobacter sp.]
AKLSTLLNRIEDGTISQKAAKDVLDVIIESDEDIDSVIERLGLKQVSDDSAILSIIDTVLASNGDKVAEYKSGKDKLFGFFVGQVMKEGKGAFNPAKVNELLKTKLG